MSLRRRLVEGPVTTAAIALGHRFLLGLGVTWNVRHVGRSRVDEARRGSGPVLYAIMHGVLLPLAWTHRDRGVRVLVSRSRDGEIITRVTDRLGYSAVRGSSSRGGREALGELERLGHLGHDLAVTPDGPRGPRGSVSPGAVVAAHRTRMPIIPIGVAADRAWHARSWDRFLVPRPGARLWVTYGEPLHPGRDGESLDLEAECRRLEAALARAEDEAIALAGGAEPGADISRIPG